MRLLELRILLSFLASSAVGLVLYFKVPFSGDERLYEFGPGPRSPDFLFPEVAESCSRWTLRDRIDISHITAAILGRSRRFDPPVLVARRHQLIRNLFGLE